MYFTAFAKFLFNKIKQKLVFFFFGTVVIIMQHLHSDSMSAESIEDIGGASEVQN